MTLLQVDAHEAALAAAKPHLKANQPFHAITAAVDAAITVAMVHQLAAHGSWMDALPDLIRTGAIPAGVVAELASACEWAQNDIPTIALHLPSRGDLYQTALDVAS